MVKSSLLVLQCPYLSMIDCSNLKILTGSNPHPPGQGTANNKEESKKEKEKKKKISIKRCLCVGSEGKDFTYCSHVD